jgi:hypothetical protein
MLAQAGSRRRIDILRDVLASLLTPEFQGSVFQFDSLCRRVWGPRYQLAEPSGATDLTDALQVVGQYFPSPLIVISDGLPTSALDPLATARGLSTAIIARFVGRDDDFKAIAFMRALAWCSADGVGDFAAHHWERPAALRSDLATILLPYSREG